MQNIKFNIPSLKPLSQLAFKASVNMSKPTDTFKKSIPNPQDTLNELSKIKINNENRFTQSDIKCFSNLKSEKINDVKYFAQTNLNAFNIKWIVEKTNVNFEKLGKLIAEIEIENKGFTANFKKDSADSSSYILSASNKEGNEQIKMLDKDLNVFSVENTKVSGNYKTTKAEDFRTNTSTEIKTDKDDVLLSKIKTFKDNSGKIIKTEYTEPSKLEGIYNIKVKNIDGIENIISEGKVDKTTGNSTIVKNLTSPDGVKTEYLYQFDKNGNRNSSYKIIDKNGKILLSNTEKFNVISDKKCVSEKNGEKYEITYDNNNISVKNNGEATEIGLNNFARGDISPMLKLSGNELIQMKNNVSKYGGSQGSFAAYNIFTKDVNTSDNKLSTLLHELGHAKDYRDTDMGISSDKTFVKTFEKEKEAFTNNSSNAERNQFEYFIRPKGHHAGENGGKVEIVAEVNSILNTCADDPKTGMRKQLLQQYFPQTIAVLSEMLANVSNKPLTTTSSNGFGH